GDPEQVADRPLVVVHVQVRVQLLPRDPGELTHPLPHLGGGPVEGPRLDDDLEPVAGRQHQGLLDVLPGADPGGEVARPLGAQRGPLEQVHRGGAVGQAHDEDAHPTAAPSAADRACSCSWTARPARTAARPTARACTVGGTRSTTGAKLRIDRTPRSTSASATPWAAAAGVVITPTPARVAAASSSSMVTTVSPSIRRPTTAGSAS